MMYGLSSQISMISTTAFRNTYLEDTIIKHVNHVNSLFDILPALLHFPININSDQLSINTYNDSQ
jgi:hypothetical protein